ncbi:uncharacterized protein LOC124889687 [Capsicum annuum]|uniref:uncharacterized protein LOC124889687 n=1 Tax=Capsicum annuum TaxID=4072 RepID=UPI001FB18919|nr:uncharacterized protein LOC124889687 [Capsicum annuum]
MGFGQGGEEVFWEVLDEVVRGIPSTEKLFLGEDFNRHIGSLSRGYDDVHGGFSFGERNKGGASLLDFARAIRLWIANASFSDKEENLITFHSSVAKTLIDFLLMRKGDRALCKDWKVIPSENLSTQHRQLMMELVIKKGRKKRNAEVCPRIKWGSLTLASALELGEKFKSTGDW